MGQELRAVSDPSVWRADEIGGKQGLSRRLDESELDAFARMLDATASRPLLELGPGDFGHPALDRLAQACRHELAHGRCALVLTGLDPARFGEKGYRRIYWYIGQLLGRPKVQSEKGDIIGYVQYEKVEKLRRGYTANFDLGFHTDFHELLSLASVRNAAQGGESGLSSSGYVHNVMLEERPDMLRALYEGWYDSLHAFWFQTLRDGDRAADAKVPLFALADGRLSYHNSVFPGFAAEERGESVPSVFGEAQAAIAEIAARPGVSARFLLEPGEMMFWHNFAVMHARSEFSDAPGQERLLWRLWLHPHTRRPIPEAMAARGTETDRMLEEIRGTAEAVAAE